MTSTIRKSRTISLRLSQQEFEALKSLYQANGARSISEFVRAAMGRLVSVPPQPTQALHLKIQEIDGKLTILDGEVARLTHLLAGHHDPH